MTPDREQAHAFQDTLFKVLVESPTSMPTAFIMCTRTNQVRILVLDMPDTDWRMQVQGAIANIQADVVVVQSEVQGVFGDGADAALQARMAGAPTLDGLPNVGIYLYSSLEIQGEPGVRSLFCQKPEPDNVYDPVQESYLNVMGDTGGADLMDLFAPVKAAGRKRITGLGPDTTEYEN